MSRGTRYKKENKKSNVGNLISFLLLIIFIVIFIFSAFKIFNYVKDSKINEKVLDDIAKDIVIAPDVSNDDHEKEKYKIDFANLKQKNNDTVGFLKVSGTDIEQVVVKGKDNSYYLYHNFEKQNNAAGWLFADYRNKFDGTDKNIIIYGHNMRNNTMFGTLKNILNSDWQENEDNRKITFITEKESAIYDVFSVYQIEAEDYYMKTDFKTGEFKKYIDSMKSRSNYNFNVNISEDDSILTLSTCANNNKYRVVLHAKKIKN